MRPNIKLMADDGTQQQQATMAVSAQQAFLLSLLALGLCSCANVDAWCSISGPSNSRRSLLVLLAKKSTQKKKQRPSTSGFGGAATETCPCGSQESYMKCCGRLHKNIFEFQRATPEQVVRARYTAYAKREIDFIIKSTHPLNQKFQADVKHWREQIDLNCYDNFELTKCEVLDSQVQDDDKTATVTFVANMLQRDSRERTAFQETSTFEKIGGAWLYKEGKIADPPGREEISNETESETVGLEKEKEAEDAVVAIEGKD